MSVLDQKCMGCGRSGREPGGFYFQSRLRLCPACHEAFGGNEGVIAFSREINAEVDVARSRIVAEHLARRTATPTSPPGGDSYTRDDWKRARREAHERLTEADTSPPGGEARAIANRPHPSERGVEKLPPAEALGLFREAASQMADARPAACATCGGDGVYHDVSGKFGYRPVSCPGCGGTGRAGGGR